MSVPRLLPVLAAALLLASSGRASPPPDTIRFEHEGLQAPVTIVKDPWGTPTSTPRTPPTCSSPRATTSRVVISRHQGLLGNIGSEPQYGRAVAALGPEAVRRVEDFGPGNPESPFYDNLFDLWANDQFVPVYYSRNEIDRVARDVIELNPDE